MSYSDVAVVKAVAAVITSEARLSAVTEVSSYLALSLVEVASAASAVLCAKLNSAFNESSSV
jgi:hypothetical protein